MTAGSVTFSSTLMPSNRLKNWNTMPMCRRRMIASSSSVRPTNGSPARETSPSVGVSSPATMLSNVDLPHPDGPITATNSPGVIVKSTPRSARTGAPSDSNVLRRPCVSTTSPAVGATPSTCFPAMSPTIFAAISPASRRSPMYQSPFHVVEHVDAVRPHRRVPPFHRRLVERHHVEVGVQRQVRALVDDDAARRSSQILQPLREVHGVAHQRVLEPL